MLAGGKYPTWKAIMGWIRKTLPVLWIELFPKAYQKQLRSKIDLVHIFSGAEWRDAYGMMESWWCVATWTWGRCYLWQTRVQMCLSSHTSIHKISKANVHIFKKSEESSHFLYCNNQAKVFIKNIMVWNMLGTFIVIVYWESLPRKLSLLTPQHQPSGQTFTLHTHNAVQIAKLLFVLPSKLRGAVNTAASTDQHHHHLTSPQSRWFSSITATYQQK